MFRVDLLHVGHAVFLLGQSLRRARCSLLNQDQVEPLEILLEAMLDLPRVLVPPSFILLPAVCSDLLHEVDRPDIEDMRDLVLLAGLVVHLLSVHILMVELVFGVELEGLIGVGVEFDVDVFGEDAIEFEV